MRRREIPKIGAAMFAIFTAPAMAQTASPAHRVAEQFAATLSAHDITSCSCVDRPCVSALYSVNATDMTSSRPPIGSARACRDARSGGRLIRRKSRHQIARLHQFHPRDNQPRAVKRLPHPRGEIRIQADWPGRLA